VVTLLVSFVLCLVYVDVLTATVACSSDESHGSLVGDSGATPDAPFDASAHDSGGSDASHDASGDVLVTDADLDAEPGDAAPDALVDAPADALVLSDSAPDAPALLDAAVDGALDATPLPDASLVDGPPPLPDASLVDGPPPLPDASLVDGPPPLPDASFVDASPSLQAGVRINELNANIATGCDLIELRVVSTGTLGSFRLTERTGGSGELDFTFPALSVAKNTLIVVHLNSGNAACNPGGATAETLSVSQQPAATFPGNYDTALDFWASDAGLVATDNVITLYDSTGKIVDAVLIANAPTGTTAAASETAAATVAAANQWHMVGGGVPTGGFVDDAFRAHAVLDCDATGTTASGTSLQRLDNTDDDEKSDWSTGVGPNSTFGAANVGQSPF